ncbi:MAG TPA: 3-oxoacyl-[acyl-carrier-protein] synthase III C-terminal domain-containing protein [Solirubrobacteraceae bacterium]
MKAIGVDFPTPTVSHLSAVRSPASPRAQAWEREDARHAEDLTADRPRISGLALSHADASFSQEDVLALLGLTGDEFAERIFRRCGVRSRQLKLTDEFLSTTVQGRTLAIEDQLLADAVRAIDKLEVDPSEIGVVVSASLYSLGGPTIAHRLLDRYEMDPATDKYHVVGVGCASAVPLVRLASQALREHPGKKALVVAAESMAGILMGASAEDERSKTVGSSIFGDGCAAALVEFDAQPTALAGSKPAAGPAIVASKVHQIGGTLGAVRMQLAADDSYLHLIRELPDVAAEGLGELVDDFLGSIGVARREIDHWLVHPGGRRIIESIQEALGLSREQVGDSFQVLSEHGNVGTPAIFYVMKTMLDRREPRDGERALMVTVGPGVTVGLMLLQW